MPEFLGLFFVFDFQADFVGLLHWKLDRHHGNVHAMVLIDEIDALSSFGVPLLLKNAAADHERSLHSLGSQLLRLHVYLQRFLRELAVPTKRALRRGLQLGWSGEREHVLLLLHDLIL